MIVEFFNNKTVFLTGCTGLYGQVILRKLLLTKVMNVYCLIRGESFQDRLARITSDPRAIAINGDTTLPNLGLSNVDEFVDHLDIVIHAASLTSFDASVDEIYNLNVRSLFEVATFAFVVAKVKEQFLLVSTSYVAAANPENFSSYDRMKGGEDPVNLIPNYQFELNLVSYLHSKCAMERMISSVFSGYAAKIIIFRPSILGCALEDPSPGWMNKASPMYCMWNCERLPISTNPSNFWDIIPVDIAANILLTHIAYSKVLSYEKIKIVNITQGSAAKLTSSYAEKYKFGEYYSGETMDHTYGQFSSVCFSFDNRSTEQLRQSEIYKTNVLDSDIFSTEIDYDPDYYSSLPRIYFSNNPSDNVPFFDPTSRVVLQDNF